VTSGSGLVRRALLASQTERRSAAVGRILRAIAPALPRRPAPLDPIFVIGAPRSGTTLVFEVLDRSPATSSLGRESHLLWDMFHPVSSSFCGSQALRPSDATDRERRVLNWCIHAIAGDRRYLDKLPRNALRVEFIRALFPTAWIVCITRDGRDVTSSLMTAWRSGRSFGPSFPPPVPLEISGYAGRTWQFIVPPGWEEYATGRSLAEVCAFQWIAANRAIVEARERLGCDRWAQLRYEDLVSRPRETVEGLFAVLGLPTDEVVEHSDTTATAVTPPRPGKWKIENGEAIQGILPMIEPMMSRLGYSVDADES